MPLAQEVSCSASCDGRGCAGRARRLADSTFVATLTAVRGPPQQGRRARGRPALPVVLPYLTLDDGTPLVAVEASSKARHLLRRSPVSALRIRTPSRPRGPGAPRRPSVTLYGAAHRLIDGRVRPCKRDRRLSSAELERLRARYLWRLPPDALDLDRAELWTLEPQWIEWIRDDGTRRWIAPALYQQGPAPAAAAASLAV